MNTTNTLCKTTLAAAIGLILTSPSSADTYTYDELNRLIYTYDELNRLISVIHLDTDQITHYTYDYEGYDIEAMDAHPEIAQIYVASGDDSVNPGHLYRLNAQTGGLTLVGDTGFGEINGLSFAPDGTLWGAAEGDGLILIELTTGVGNLQDWFVGFILFNSKIRSILIQTFLKFSEWVKMFYPVNP